MVAPNWTHLLLQPRAVKGHLEEYMGCTCQSCNAVVMFSVARVHTKVQAAYSEVEQINGGALDEAVGPEATIGDLKW